MNENLSRVNEAFESFERALNQLNASNPRIEPYYQSLVGGLNTLSLSFGRLLNGIEERQELIDVQCKQNIFSGPIHEKYHAVSNELHSDFDIFYSSLKTALNRLVTLIFHSLPPQHSISLNPENYGYFLESLKQNNDPELAKLKSIFLGVGQKLNEANKYRNAYIEHLDFPTKTSTLSSDPRMGVRKLHYDIPTPEKNIESSASPNPLADGGSDVLKFELENGEYVYYVHMIPCDWRVKEIKRGDPMAYVSDGGSGHFSKYGPHRHVFASPNFPQQLLFTDSSESSASLSPATFESISELATLLKLTGDILLFYVKK